MRDCEVRLYIRGDEGRMGGRRWKKLLTESWRGCVARTSEGGKGKQQGTTTRAIK